MSLISEGWRILKEEGFGSFLYKALRYPWKTGFKPLLDHYILKTSESLEKFRNSTPTRREIVNFNGVKVPLEMHLFDYISSVYHLYPIDSSRSYEAVEVEGVRSYCDEGDHVVVVGGGLGVTAVAAARQVGPEGKVVVYEQDNRICDMTKNTVEANDCTEQIEVYCKGIEEQGPSNLASEELKNVDIISASDLPSADVLEMDCEGAEEEILENLDNNPSSILVETHSNHENIKALLLERGYDIEEVVKDAPRQAPQCTYIRASLDTGETE